jgi:hypothetical protein
MIQTGFDLLQGDFFCLSSGRMQHVTDNRIDLIHCILVIGYWNLRFICNLVLEIWDLTNFMVKKKYY